jgi:cell division septation protein DedD
LTGVYVGPVLTETEAATLQQELARSFQLEGVVVRFSIEELQ